MDLTQCIITAFARANGCFCLDFRRRETPNFVFSCSSLYLFSVCSCFVHHFTFFICLFFNFSVIILILKCLNYRLLVALQKFVEGSLLSLQRNNNIKVQHLKQSFIYSSSSSWEMWPLLKGFFGFFAVYWSRALVLTLGMKGPWFKSWTSLCGARGFTAELFLQVLGYYTLLLLKTLSKAFSCSKNAAARVLEGSRKREHTIFLILNPI